MPKTTPSPDAFSPSALLPSGPLSLREGMPSTRPNVGLPRPVAVVCEPDGAAASAARQVRITLAQAPLGARVYLERRSPNAPRERIRAFESPLQTSSGAREFSAFVPPGPRGSSASYAPVAVLDGRESQGDEVRVDGLGPANARRPQTGVTSDRDARDHTPDPVRPRQLPAPLLELVAHVEADLPTFTVFGPTPEGFRITFFIKDGTWSGPRIQARYEPEGGDWLVVRRDGIAVPNARATLVTSDGARLYYELTGSIDLGPDGYARSVRNQWPDSAGLSLVARISTSSERWSWLNRLTLVGTGSVDLKIGRTYYDLFSIECDPSALR